MRKKQTESVISNEEIIPIDYTDEMQKSYVDYAISVITDRALPDVRDGLKPVHRRILWTMKSLGLKSDGSYKKAARIVGETMGKYHPHGDSSIYDAMTHMAQDWVYIYPLVDGHGNFGSIEGDSAAASRYTEAKLAAMTEEVFLQDLDKDVVDFVPNFDDAEKEPTILPVKIPTLLLHGTDGIAVGMASKMPTHNLGEIVDGTIALIDNPKLTSKDLMKYIKGPDFATGGVISNGKELADIYETGNGKIRIRGRIKAVTDDKGKKSIIITEIPYTMIGAIDKFMETIADLVRSKTLPDITDIKNFSGKDGIKIEIDVKKDTDTDRYINILYKKAKFEDTFGYNALALCDKVPTQLSLKAIIEKFIEFNNENHIKKYTYLLDKENKLKEIKEGFLKAIDCIDTIIEILRGSNSISIARECLTHGQTSSIKFKTKSAEKQAKTLRFTDIQTDAILDMKLQRLVGLEVDTVQKELKAHEKNISEYSGYLDSKVKMKNKIKSELTEIKTKYSKPRKTVITNAEEVVITEEKVKEEDVYILIDRFFYIKYIDEQTYERNKESVYKDYKYVIKAKNIDKLILFTDTAKCHSIKICDIPLTKYKEKGVSINQISNFVISTENIVFISPLMDVIKDKLVFVNNNGMCKIVKGDEFDASKKTIDSTKNDGSIIVYIGIIDSNQSDIVMATNEGMYVRFKTSEISEFKKTSVGVRGIKLKNTDKVIFSITGNSKTGFDVDDKHYVFTDIKLTKRDSVGTKKK